jgi:hypothetical protein
MVVGGEASPSPLPPKRKGKMQKGVCERKKGGNFVTYRGKQCRLKARRLGEKDVRI